MGVHDNKNNSNLDHDADTVESIIDSETLPGSSSMSRCDEQPPVKSASQGTGSCENLSLNDKLVLTRCTLQKGATNGKSDNEVSYPSNVVNGTIAEGNDSGETVNALMADTGSDKHLGEDAGVVVSED